MDVEEIENPNHREFITEVLDSLSSGHPGKNFSLDIAYSSHEGSTVGKFVRPRYVIKEKRRLRRDVSVLEVGDGPLQCEIDEATDRDRKAQLRGNPPRQPENLGLIQHINKDYFPKGSDTREILDKVGIYTR